MRTWFAFTARDTRDLLLSLLPTAFALWISAHLVTGVRVESPFWLLASAAVLAIGDLIVRPLLGPLVALVGPLPTVIVGVAVQLALLHTALTAVPGLDLSSLNALWQVYFWTGLVGVVARWVIGSNDSRWVVRELLRRRPRPHDDVREPGLLVVQIDGLSMPLLQFGLHSGTLTTIARWLREGSHHVEGWHAQLPSTTPASQAGFLHGSTEEIPAFRWWDPELGRVLVANRPADAAVIETRVREAAHAAGRTGLLAGDGASIGNLFSGEASHAHLVVSTSRAGGSGRPYLRYVARPFVLLRSLLLTVGEIFKEIYQGWQQRVRRVEPRIPRRGWYVLLRALTNALLRDLNVALVAQELADGRPVVFVDFLDYDEVAHHAGVARAESLDALAGVDRVLQTLADVAAVSPREYRVVLLSDHGQAQGSTFRQLSGRHLRDVVAELLDREGPSHPVVTTADGEEMRGRVDVLVREFGTSAKAERVSNRHEEEPASGADAIVVATSGCTALLSVPEAPDGRIDLAEFDRRWPALVPGLLETRGVGFVVGRRGAEIVVIGFEGEHELVGGHVSGTDPLLPFGPRAAGDLLRVMRFRNAPALFVHSTLDPVTGEVHAFEEQVGSHGGLGGWQTEAVLVHPAEWKVAEDLRDRSVPGEAPIVGAATIHEQLVRWMREVDL